MLPASHMALGVGQWDNPSIDDKLKADSLKVKEYGKQHGSEKLASRKWTTTGEDAWAMAALAVKLAGAEGAYRPLPATPTSSSRFGTSKSAGRINPDCLLGGGGAIELKLVCCTFGIPYLL
jgi:hypothetical protein